MSTPRLLFAVTIATITAPTLSRLLDGADSEHPSFGLAATVKAGAAAETLPVEDATSVTVAHCGRLCEQHDGLCVGFSWLPQDGALKGALVRQSEGQCHLLPCAPEGPTPTGPALLYLSVPSTRAPPSGRLHLVPEGYKHQCTYAYKVYKDKMNFTDASDICRDDGGRLFFSRTQAQHSTINAAVVRSVPHWIGLADLHGSRTFQWLDGSAPELPPKWGKAQPNDYKTEGETEPQACVMLHNSVWNDEQCTRDHSFVCQIPFVDV